jgi:hypothetical protein
MTTPHERRRDARLPLDRPVKVQCLHTGRYLAGHTCNLSTSGALVEIDHPSLLIPGQRIKVGVAQTRQDVILKSEEMAQATVVRSMGHRGTQRVAIVFDQRQELALVG